MKNIRRILFVIWRKNITIVNKKDKNINVAINYKKKWQFMSSFRFVIHFLIQLKQQNV